LHVIGTQSLPFFAIRRTILDARAFSLLDACFFAVDIQFPPVGTYFTILHVISHFTSLPQVGSVILHVKGLHRITFFATAFFNTFFATAFSLLVAFFVVVAIKTPSIRGNVHVLADSIIIDERFGTNLTNPKGHLRG